MNFKTIAKVGSKRILAEYQGKSYILSFSEQGNEVLQVESPESIIRQGYWQPYDEKNEAKKKEYINLIEASQK